jgi:hypothetical protein
MEKAGVWGWHHYNNVVSRLMLIMLVGRHSLARACIDLCSFAIGILDITIVTWILMVGEGERFGTCVQQTLCARGHYVKLLLTCSAPLKLATLMFPMLL